MNDTSMNRARHFYHGRYVTRLPSNYHELDMNMCPGLCF